MYQSLLILLLALIMGLPAVPGDALVYNTKKGQLENVEPNWLVDNLGDEKNKLYYKIAEVNIPDGYKDLGGLKNDPLEQNFFLAPTAEDAMVENVLIMSMPGQKPQDMAAKFEGSGDYLLISEPMQVELAGKDVHMKLITCANYSMDAYGTTTNSIGLYYMVASYTSARKEGSLMVCLTTRDFPSMEELPSKEDIIFELENIYTGINIME